MLNYENAAVCICHMVTEMLKLTMSPSKTLSQSIFSFQNDSNENIFSLDFGNSKFLKVQWMS